MQALSDEEIREIAKKVGHPRGKGHGKKPVDVEKVRQMLATGFSKAQIGKYFHVSEATISRRLREGRLRYSWGPSAIAGDGPIPR